MIREVSCRQPLLHLTVACHSLVTEILTDDKLGGGSTLRILSLHTIKDPSFDVFSDGNMHTETLETRSRLRTTADLRD